MYYFSLSHSAHSYLYSIKSKTSIDEHFNANDMTYINYEIEKEIKEVIRSFDDNNIVNLKAYKIEHGINYEVEALMENNVDKELIKDKIIHTLNQLDYTDSVVVEVSIHKSLPSRYQLSLTLGAIFMFFMLYFSLPIRI